jgi:hypothetical protein
VHVTKTLLQPYHGLAVGGEAEMPRLDDPGVDRAHGNLVQAFALGRQECIGWAGERWSVAFSQRVLHIPEPEI